MADPAETIIPDSNAEQGGEQLDPVNKSRSESLRSFTRLAVGGVEVGLDELVRLLQIWEAEIARSPLPTGQEAVFGVEAEPKEPPQPTTSPLVAKPTDTLRYALIGLIFETQEQVTAGFQQAGRLERAASYLLDPWIKPLKSIYHSRALSPARRRYEGLIGRGEAEMARWVEVGRAEEARSRALARVAFDKTVDQYIEYLTTNPEVQELVQTQSTGLANEVIEEVRERTVSADSLLEGMARSFLRRLPRRALPPPPTLRMIAAPRQAKIRGKPE